MAGTIQCVWIGIFLWLPISLSLAVDLYAICLTTSKVARNHWRPVMFSGYGICLSCRSFFTSNFLKFASLLWLRRVKFSRPNTNKAKITGQLHVTDSKRKCELYAHSGNPVAIVLHIVACSIRSISSKWVLFQSKQSSENVESVEPLDSIIPVLTLYTDIKLPRLLLFGRHFNWLQQSITWDATHESIWSIDNGSDQFYMWTGKKTGSQENNGWGPILFFYSFI